MTMLLFVNANNFAQVQQNSNVENTTSIQIHNNEPVDDIPPLFFFFVGFVILAIVVFISTIILSVIGFFSLIGIIPLGIVSGSFFIGLYKKSFSAGFQILLLSTCSVIGIIGVISAMFILNILFSWFSVVSVIIVGVFLGGFLGMLLGFVLFIILKKLARFVEGNL